MDGIALAFSDSSSSDSSLSDSSLVSNASYSIQHRMSSLMSEEVSEKESYTDAFLLEAMTCSICFMIFNEPKQLQCGHSFCTSCIDQLCNETKLDYSCPLCRAHLDSPPVVNYSLKSLISRLMEKNAMVKPCYQCSKSARPEDQYCCDDCDHIHKAENVLCGLCTINGHAKMGHAISKFGESKERVKTAQETIHKMTSEIVKFMDVCKKLVFDRLNAVENLFKLLDEQYAQFTAIEAALNADQFISKTDIDIKLEHARRLHEIYMRTVAELARLLNGVFSEVTVLTERTGVELRTNAVYMYATNTDESTAQSADISNNFGEQRQSWFEYQRTGRLKSLCSAVARRSAAVARRHSQSKPEVIGNLMPQTFSAIPVTFLHPGTPIPSSRNESDPT